MTETQPMSGVLSNTRRLALLLGCCALTTAAAAQTSRPIEAREELRLDAIKENFTEPGFVIAFPSGGVAISQPQDFEILFFDSTGKRVGKIGRKGAGPGEFGVYTDMQQHRAMLNAGTIGDSLWIYDAVLRRMTYATSRGVFLRTELLPASLPGLYGNPNSPATATQSRTLLRFMPLALLTGGELIGEASYGTRVNAGRNRTVIEQSAGQSFAVYDQHGALKRTLAAFPRNEGSVTVTRNNGTLTIGGAVPFFPRPHTNVARNGSRVAILTTSITSAEGGTFRVLIVDASGVTTLDRSYPFKGMPLPRGAADSMISAHFRQYGRQGSGFPAMPRDMTAELEKKMRDGVPPARPPVRGILFGSDDSFCVGLVGEKRDQYLLMNGKGELIGEIKLPDGAYPVAFSREIVWAGHRDSDRLPSIIRYRIRPRNVN